MRVVRGERLAFQADTGGFEHHRPLQNIDSKESNEAKKSFGEASSF